MQFPDCHGRPRQRWRTPLSAFVMLALATLVAAAHAAGFDEKLKAPAMTSPADIQQQAQSFAARYRELFRTEPEQLIRNSALARQQFDLKWQMQRAIDEHQPLDELATLGIISRGDGSYAIDLGEYPEWNDLHETMAGLISHAPVADIGPNLINRGFRPEDVTTLKDYVDTHNSDDAAARDALPIVLGFAKVVRKYDKLKRPVPDSIVKSFMYQRARAISESNRRWVEALLASLDAQRARVVMSTFTELKPSALWIPEDTRQGIADYLATVRHPDFEAHATAEAKGVAR